MRWPLLRQLSALLAVWLVLTSVPARAASASAGFGREILAVADSVVGIVVSVPPSTPGGPVEYRRGTGVAFRTGGYVVTSADLFPGARSVDLLLPGGRRRAVDVHAAVWGDSLTGVAVLRAPEVDLPPAHFAAGPAPPRGTRAVTLAAPLFGRQAFIASAGTVSGTGRRLGTGHPFLQVSVRTDAGTQGAPVVGSNGEVFGLISHKVESTEVEGMVFAIPAHVLVPVAEQLVTTGKVGRAWLGVQLAEDAEAELAIPDAGAVSITAVLSGSPAAGQLQAGMVLKAMAGRPIHSVEDVASILAAQQPGSPVSLQVKFGDVEQDFRIVLGEQPAVTADLRDSGLWKRLNPYQQERSMRYANESLGAGYWQFAERYLAYNEAGVATLQTEFMRLAYLYWRAWRSADEGFFTIEPRSHAAQIQDKLYVPVWLALATPPTGTALVTLHQGNRVVGETRAAWTTDSGAVGMPVPVATAGPGGETTWYGLTAVIPLNRLEAGAPPRLTIELPSGQGPVEFIWDLAGLE